MRILIVLNVVDSLCYAEPALIKQLSLNNFYQTGPIKQVSPISSLRYVKVAQSSSHQNRATLVFIDSSIPPSMLAARRAEDIEEVPMPLGVKAYAIDDIPLMNVDGSVGIDEGLIN